MLKQEHATLLLSRQELRAQEEGEAAMRKVLKRFHRNRFKIKVVHSTTSS